MKYLPMKMEPIVSSETSAIRTQKPGNYPKRNNLHLEHGESLRTRYQSVFIKYCVDISDRDWIYMQGGFTTIKPLSLLF